MHKRSCGRGGCHGPWGGGTIDNRYSCVRGRGHDEARCIIKEVPLAGFVLCFEVLRPASVVSYFLLTLVNQVSKVK